MVHAPPRCRPPPATRRDTRRARAADPTPDGSTRSGWTPTARVAPARPAAAGATDANAEVLVLGDPVPELARVALPRVAGLLALELARDEAVRGAVDRARRAEPMPSAGPPWVLPSPGSGSRGTRTTRRRRAAREAVRRQLRLLAPARRLSLRGDADSIEIRIVIAAAEAERIGSSARSVRSSAGRSRSRRRSIPPVRREARATLDAALVLLPSRPRSRGRRAPAMYRMLGALHKLPDGPALARPCWHPCSRAARRSSRASSTLRALLAYGSVGEAAAALGVHRNTVTGRALPAPRNSTPQPPLPIALQWYAAVPSTDSPRQSPLIAAGAGVSSADQDHRGAGSAGPSRARRTSRGGAIIGPSRRPSVGDQPCDREAGSSSPQAHQGLA